MLTDIAHECLLILFSEWNLPERGAQIQRRDQLLTPPAWKGSHQCGESGMRPLSSLRSSKGSHNKT